MKTIVFGILLLIFGFVIFAIQDSSTGYSTEIILNNSGIVFGIWFLSIGIIIMILGIFKGKNNEDKKYETFRKWKDEVVGELYTIENNLLEFTNNIYKTKGSAPDSEGYKLGSKLSQASGYVNGARDDIQFTIRKEGLEEAIKKLGYGEDQITGFLAMGVEEDNKRIANDIYLGITAIRNKISQKRDEL